MTLDHIWGLKALSKPYHQACIDWAEQLLIAGNSSENVLILASLGLDKVQEFYEVEGYFERAVHDLGEIEPEYFSAIKNYGLYICHQMLAGELALEENIDLLAEVYPSTNYDYGIFTIWSDLCDDLDMLGSDDPYYGNTLLTKANKLTYIENQLRHFIVLLNSDVPSNFMSLYICQGCNKLVKARWQQRTRISGCQKLMIQLKLQKPKYATECLFCGSTNVTGLHTIEAREKALTMLNN
ncbi:hypothetical protein [Ewingella americana]|uniref:Uncharacterized protein n=1 Tax=Ewingella americana TaxID=41202 RepID=A0A502GJJ3_9GAMM|nr:hypothetical protein [Ewingella americana]TPG61981.1 hypothetical protein EAH77_11070 [Ewingella americana]